MEATTIKVIDEVALLEKELAIQRADVDSEGTPPLTVVVNGSWAKRSYRINFASLSGTVISTFLCINLRDF